MFDPDGALCALRVRLAKESASMPATKAKRMPLPSGESLATAFRTGDSVMLIEILGTRVISPVFSISLFF
jgi:hypothetical protein